MRKEEIKYSIIAVIVIVLVFVAFKYGKEIAERVRERKRNRELYKHINKDNLTYGNSQYDVFAKKLFTAMDGLGSDEDAIYDVFKKMKTIDDVLMLQVAFNEAEDENETLEEWLKGDLSSSEIKTINNLLESNGVIYSF